MNEPAVTLVIITYNRAQETLRTVQHAIALREAARIIVIDNASTDGTPELLRSVHPEVLVVRLTTNLGAAARNVGVAIARTPLVALCDDDISWQPGALTHAQRLLEEHPRLAVLCAQVIVLPRRQVDPTCVLMEHSPLIAAGLPGTALLGFLAGASVIRRCAFVQAGGFDSRLFIGGEEALLALDLAAHGWRMAYVPDVVAHHRPSTRRDADRRRQLLLRNALYVACMRLPVLSALGEALSVCVECVRKGCLAQVSQDIAAALPWLLQARRVIPAEVERARRLVHAQRSSAMSRFGRSAARSAPERRRAPARTA